MVDIADDDAASGRDDRAQQPGRAYAPQYSDQMARNRRSRYVALGSVVGLCLAGYGVYTLSQRRAAPTQEAMRLPKSEPVYVKEPPAPPEAPSIVPHLDINPPVVTFGTLTASKDSQTLSVVLTAVDGTLDVSQVSLPFAAENGLDMRADGCQRRLTANERCAITVKFTPTQASTLNNNILVTGTAYLGKGSQEGKTNPLSTIIEVTGAAAMPPPPPPPPPPVRDASLDQLNAIQANYLAQRAHAGALGDQAARAYFRGPKIPVDKDWSGLGFAKSVSSLPVDMTRVVTMDKAIPVVIKVPVDTRNASRAVATVERDIYGGDGRLVLIERGSTLIGKVAAIADTSEEKVAIAWQRLVRPDGVAFAFSSTSGDAMGRSGVLAHIDNRWFERFGKAALFSFVRGGITLALNPTQTAVTQNGTSASGVNGSVQVGGTTSVAENGRTIATQQIQSDLLPLYEQFTKEQLQIPPIRTVPAGTRVTVWPASDLWLQEVPVDEPDAAPTARFASSRPGGFYQTNGATPAPAALAAPAPARAANPLNDALGVVTPDPVQGMAPAPTGTIEAVPVDTSIGDKSASSTLHDRFSARSAAATGMGVVSQPSTATAVSPGGQALAAPPWMAR